MKPPPQPPPSPPPCQHLEGRRFKINDLTSPRLSDRLPLWWCPECKTTYVKVEREKEEHGKLL
jgi:hypothetical protein